MRSIPALLSVIAVLICGVVAGALGMHVYEAHRGRSGWMRGRPPGPPPHLVLHEMEKRLDLTPDQKERISGILERSRQESEAIRSEVRPRLESQMERMRQEIEAVLTPPQRQKFDELRREQRRRFRRFFLGEDATGPGPSRSGPPPSGPPPGPPDPDDPPDPRP